MIKELIALTLIFKTSLLRLYDFLEKHNNDLTDYLSSEKKISENQTADNNVYLEKAEEIIDKCEHNYINILTVFDNKYPRLLKEIRFPPPVIYVKGNTDILNSTSVAVVGTRKPDTYGKNVTSDLCNRLCEKNITIVSGLAVGIDSLAHKSATNNNKPTTAVLANGLEKIYPAINTNLAKEIIDKNGTLISEFPPGTPPARWNFPRRNRIISGLSIATIVVQAGEKSGALITARFALEQNRDVFAVPGSIYSQVNAGNNGLIKEGAVPIISFDNILSEINIQGNLFNKIDSKKTYTENNTVNLTIEENKVYSVLSSEAPLRLDQISRQTELSIPECITVLLELELKNLITQHPGQTFTKL